MLSRSKIGRRKREGGSDTREAWLWVTHSAAWEEWVGALGGRVGCGPGKRQWVPVLNPALDSFRNVIFDITPGDEAGRFEVNAKFLGVDMERFQLHYQVRGHSHEPSRYPLGFRR